MLLSLPGKRKKCQARGGLGLWVLLVLGSFLPSCSIYDLEHGPKEEVDPDFVEITRLLQRGDSEEAEQRLQVLIRQRPLHVAAHREMQKLRLARFENFDLIRDYRALCTELPDSAGARYLLGRLLFKYDAQKRGFNRAVALDPGDPWGHYGLAWVAAGQGEVDVSFSHINYALAAQPGHNWSRYLLTRHLMSQARFVEARGVLTLLLKDYPHLHVNWILMARLSQMEGKYAQELDALEGALAISPENQEARGLLLALAKNQRDTALGFLARDLGKKSVKAKNLSENDRAFLLELEAIDARHSHTLRDLAIMTLRHGKKGSQRTLLYGEFDPKDYFQHWRSLYGSHSHHLKPVLGKLGSDLEKAGSFQPRDALHWAERFARAGLVDYAQYLVEHFDLEGPFASRLHKHQRVLARLQVLVQEIQEQESEDHEESLAQFLAHVRGVIEQETGYVCDQEEPTLGLPLVGSALDASKARAGTINGYFARFNQIMFAGRLDGSATQALVFTTVSGPTQVKPLDWPVEQGCVEVIGAMVAVRSQDETFGDNAGRALFGTYFLDLDVLLPWSRRLERVENNSDVQNHNLLDSKPLSATGFEERQSLDFPGSTATALTKKAFDLHGELPMLDLVRVHEQGHLFDSFNYLPLWQQVLPNLLLILRGGFSSVGIMAELEEAAALHALKQAQSPHLALAELVRSLTPGEPRGPHAQGYRNLLKRFLIRLDHRVSEFIQLEPDAVLLHQLHRLTEEQIRQVAREI